MNYAINPNGGVTRDDGACIPEAPGNRDWDNYLVWCEEGNTADSPPAPTLPDVADVMTPAVQAWLDVTVRGNGYDDIASCISYINSTVDAWRDDATAALHWRDAVWQAAYAMRADALANPPTVVPTIEQVIAGLPQPETFGWVVHAPGAGS